MTDEARVRRRRAFQIGYMLCAGSLAVSAGAAIVNVTLTERFRWWFAAAALLASLAGFGLLRYGMRPVRRRELGQSPPVKGQSRQ